MPSPEPDASTSVPGSAGTRMLAITSFVSGSIRRMSEPGPAPHALTHIDPKAATILYGPVRGMALVICRVTGSSLARLFSPGNSGVCGGESPPMPQL